VKITSQKHCQSRNEIWQIGDFDNLTSHFVFSSTGGSKITTGPFSHTMFRVEHNGRLKNTKILFFLSVLPLAKI